MIKALILSIFVVFASARIGHLINNNSSSLTQFLTGFNDELKITSPKDMDKCADVPLIHDIMKALNDLKLIPPKFIHLVQDGIHIYHDVKTMEKSCPDVAKVYEDYFQNFTDHAFKNPQKTFAHVVSNVGHNAKSFSKHVVTAEIDLQKGNDYSAGKEVADATAIALKDYIRGL